MKFSFSLSFGLLVLCLTSCVSSIDYAKINTVENGLLPTIVFKGDQPWTLQERMQHYGVPGVGIAVIKDSKIAWYKTYGLSDRETGEAISSTTLFQAGSISKPVAAFAALQLVEAGKISLNADINSTLISWKLPDNELTADNKVTLRQLLSHTGGLTVHGFGGYAAGEQVPSLVQILNGEKPANSAPVLVNKKPGEGFRYSGGGYTIAQLMMSDVTGKPFAQLMDDLLIKSIGMSQSSYAQPLPVDWLKQAAAGVLPNGNAVKGKRHTYPEQAAAGLWSTAEDLALFTIEMQKALKGESKLMSKKMAQTMTTPVDSGYALGWGISAQGDAGYFSHGGWDEGFSSQLTSSLNNGVGVVVMINSNHPKFINEVVNAVAHAYSWNGYQTHDVLPVPEGWVSKYKGRYRLDAVRAITVTSDNEKLFMNFSGGEPEELIYTGDGLLMRRSRPNPVSFTDSENGPSFSILVKSGEKRLYRRLNNNEKLPAEVLEQGQYEDALKAFRNALDAEPNDEALSEQSLNKLGLRSLVDNEAFAIKLLRINTGLYPDSANTWDSLAYAHKTAGNREKAIEHFRNALKRDPKFSTAMKGLAELDAKQ